MKSGLIIKKGSPSIKNFFNKQTDISGKFTIYRHQHTNYDEIGGRLTRKFGEISPQYIEFTNSFADDIISQLKNPAHIQEVKIWLWGKHKKFAEAGFKP